MFNGRLFYSIGAALWKALSAKVLHLVLGKSKEKKQLILIPKAVLSFSKNTPPSPLAPIVDKLLDIYLLTLLLL